MKIKTILSQSRRDFKAIYECEHCGHTQEGNGYDDANFHHNIIPIMPCKQCNKIAGKDYEPRDTKYPEGMIV